MTTTGVTARSPSGSSSGPQRIFVLGKRFYTNKDALKERFGRIFQLPSEWSSSGVSTRLLLIDYHSRESLDVLEGALRVVSEPVFSLQLPSVLFGLCLRFRPEVIVATGDCYLGLLGWVLARLSGAIFVFDIYDKYDDFGAYRRPLGFDLFGFLRRKAEVRFYASKALAHRYAEEGQPGELIANGVDAQTFGPRDPRDCRRMLELDPERYYVGYFGGMEPDRGVKDLIDAIRVIRACGTDIRLLICGRKHLSTPLEEGWIDYRGMVPHTDMPLYINACNLLAVPYRLSSFMDMGASCKIAEFLICEKPLVSTRTPNFTRNFPEQALQLGEALCNPEDVRDLSRAIRYQISASRTVTPPVDMTWPHIARKALSAIRGMYDSRMISER